MIRTMNFADFMSAMIIVVALLILVLGQYLIEHYTSDDDYYKFGRCLKTVSYICYLCAIPFLVIGGL